MRQRIGGIAGIAAKRIERQQEERPRVRRSVPVTNRLGHVAISHENGVHGRAKKTLDEQRRRLIRADEITQWAEDCAVAELFSFAQQARGGRCETDTLSLERVERVDLSLQRRMHFVGAKQLGARRRLAIARLAIRGSDFLESRRCVFDSSTRFSDGDRCLLQLAINCSECVGKLGPFGTELLYPLR
jgi:hypothetical protein